MSTEHRYALTVSWTPVLGDDTFGSGSYSRDHKVQAEGLPVILGSSDPEFRGDPTRWNPEQLFLASVAQCHMLWYLHLAAAAGIVVIDYQDQATGVMVEEHSGEGAFTSMTLHPTVTITDAAQQDLAEQLHARVGSKCFIARSVVFPIFHQPTTLCQTRRA